MMADWMAFNVADYTANTLHLTTRQHGGYILLICAAWSGKGFLPGTDAGLMAIAKLTPKEWAQDGDTLKAFLTWRDDEWVHERVEFEWNDSHALIAAKSRAGKEGARRRWSGRGNGSAMTEPSDSHRQNDTPQPLPKPIPNPSQGEISGVAASAVGDPNGPPRSPSLPDTAKWVERLANHKPLEGKHCWKAEWGLSPDSAGRNGLIPPNLYREWRQKYDAEMAASRAGRAA